MQRCIALFGLLMLSTPAAAQSTYVGASLVGDIARFTKVNYDNDTPRILGDLSIDGEAIGFNVKVGRAFTERWGLEFEYARSGTFEDNFPQFLPAWTTERLLPTLPSGTVVSIPSFDLDVTSERHHMSMSALAFVRQDVGERVELSFLGGIAFNRISTKTDYDVDIRGLANNLPIFLDDIEAIEYHAGPSVGAEAAFKLGDSAAITGGVRLHAVSGSGRSGWVIRPNVGMRWQF